MCFPRQNCNIRVLLGTESPQWTTDGPPLDKAEANLMLVQGLDAHRGPEKERIIFETAFRSVQADQPDPPADPSSTSPDRATLHVPARQVAAKALGTHLQHAGVLRRGGARLVGHRRGPQERLLRPVSVQAQTFVRLI